MKCFILFFMLSLFKTIACAPLFAQIVLKSDLDTTSSQHKVTLGGYLDTYYGYDFNKPISGDRPYFVSMARHNEVTINLAYLGLRYTSSKVRARFIPGFGTYVNSNYASEPGSLKNIIEGNIGVKISTGKNIWVDAGVLNSPYTNETAVSKDQLMYSRSFAPEYVPYYLSGVKFSMSLNEKSNFSLYLINGWQQIVDQNKGKSIGTQLEYRPTPLWVVNWSTYLGDERSDAVPQNRMRYFSEINFRFSKGPFTATSCVYGGVQKVLATNNGVYSKRWWQINVIGQYTFSKKLSLSGRIEYFNDPNSVMITPITSVSGFSSYSSGMCLNLNISPTILARFEGRAFFSEQEVYERMNIPVKTSNLLISSLAVSF
jgi:hypothetical protein